MSLGAWIFLSVTWAVTIGFAGRLFWKVLTLPMKRDVGAEPEDQGAGRPG